jgi:hypothetical protein
MDTNKKEESDLANDKNLKNAERNNVTGVKTSDLRRDNNKPVASDRDPKHQDPRNQEPAKHPTNEDPTKHDPVHDATENGPKTHDKAKPATGGSR